VKGWLFTQAVVTALKSDATSRWLIAFDPYAVFDFIGFGFLSRQAD
jgi:hypothetical protein